MSVELAAITSLRKTIIEKAGVIHDFTLTAGDNFNIGNKIAIGTDGKAYLEFRPNKSMIEDEIRTQVGSVIKSSGTTSNTLIIDNIFVTNNGVFGSYSSIENYTTNGYSETGLFYIYKDSDGNYNIKIEQVESMNVVDTYNDNNRWRHYSQYLHQIDNNNYILVERFNQDYYDGNNWVYKDSYYYRQVVLDEDNQDITVGSQNSLFENDRCGYDWSICNNHLITSYDSKTIYVLNGSQRFARLTVNSDNELDIANDNTSPSVSSNNYGLWKLKDENGNVKVVWLNSNFTNAIHCIDSATNDDVTVLRNFDDTDPDYDMRFIKSLDYNLILTTTSDNSELYVIEYNFDGTVKSKNKVTTIGFLPIEIYQSAFKLLPTDALNVNNDYIVNLQTNETFVTDDGYLQSKQIIIKIYQDSNGNYYAKKLLDVGSIDKNMLSKIINNGDDILFISPTNKNASYKAELNLKTLLLDLDYEVYTTKINAYAKTQTNAGDSVIITTTENPIDVDISAGEIKGDLVGIKDGIALPILKGE